MLPVRPSKACSCATGSAGTETAAAVGVFSRSKHDVLLRTRVFELGHLSGTLHVKLHTMSEGFSRMNHLPIRHKHISQHKDRLHTAL